MIWGLALEPGHDYTTRSEDEVHLSLAAIESRVEIGKAGSYSQLVLKTNDTEQLLCTLVHGTIFQQCLDLKLMAGEEVTFSVQGSCGVYITGYSYRNPLEPTADIRERVETTQETSDVTYEDELCIKTEPAEDEAEEERVDDPAKESCKMDATNITADTDMEEGSDSDRLPLAQDQNTDGEIQQTSSVDPQQNNEKLNDKVLPKIELELKEASLPGPSRTTALLKNLIKRKTTDVHTGENGSSLQKMNYSDSKTQEETNRIVTTDITSKASTVPLGAKVGGPSTNSDSGSGSAKTTQRTRGMETPAVLIPSSQSSPGSNPSATPDEKYTCPLCLEAFPGKDTLLVHEQKHAQEGKMFGCRYCHMVFLQKGNRNIHERIHSAMRHNFRAAFKNQGDYREKSRRPSLDEVMKESKTETPKSPAGSSAHEKNKPTPSHRKDRLEAKSMLRSRPYPHYSGLGLRAQQPVEVKNYSCQFCEKPFKRNYDRNRHERIHTGQKPYECSYCDQAFSRREHCKKHEFTHLRSRPCDDDDDDDE
ncbi:uncharacterized protein [Apostichopus japonicus]|uniref:uncharacterized protein n=1 Tax=Stichopus japonicus TaxID=307972 RepID=UPI003AB83FEC